MCGICGYVSFSSFLRMNDVKRMIPSMNSSLSHRGPDDEGDFYAEDSEVMVGLGHRRLSIIDLSPLGHQPMSNKGKWLWTAFNGEIYNYKQIKEEAKDYPFLGDSDTEAILYLYEKDPEGFVERLDGMFSLSLWDKRERRLILARDPMGKKPLYYAVLDRTLVFASEIKALLHCPLINRELDSSSLAKYLFYGYIPAPNSIFKQIKKLKAGHILFFDKNGAKTRQYWTPKFSSCREKVSEDCLISEFRDLLIEAVKKRLVSDVPLGCFLSGGIDSSTIALIMSQLISPIKTFSIGFTIKGYDELMFARKVAKLIGSDHYDEILGADKLLEVVPKIPDVADEPLADASLIPTYLLSQITRKKVTVALGGDGGDELFAGYPTYPGDRVADYYERLPHILRDRLIPAIINLLPVRAGNYTIDYIAKKFVLGRNFPPSIRHYIWQAYLQANEVKSLLSGKFFLEEESLFSEIDSYSNECNSDDIVERAIFLDMKLYFPESILVKVDRASMAHSLEVRAPFLDKKLMEFVNSLPINLKLRGFTGKYILKRLMKGLLPDEILYRKKQGFSVPIGEWIRKELKDLTLGLLQRSNIEKSRLNYDAVERLLSDHFSLKRNNWKQIWALMVFQLWSDTYKCLKKSDTNL
ncbi:MAG: asparagine synthase (glutamine-hydrolyzing) [bacterium]|nr:asparagine synthase (glutamine-hydrolyzing) [bacterium]